MNIAVAAAVAMTLGIEGIIPDSDADVGDAGVRQHLKDIRRVAFRVSVDNAAGFLRENAGGVHAENEILRQVFHLPHIEG